MLVLVYDFLRTESQTTFLQFTAELLTSGTAQCKEDAHALFQDWCAARGRLWTEVTSKVSYFQQLPWKLLQLAHHDPCKATMGAQQCLKLWSLGGIGACHKQSQRFLNPLYNGGIDDPPLRQFVERIAAGEDARGEGFLPIQCWLGRFQSIKLAERSVEGIHSIVTRSLKRAPAASVGYLSMELRYQTFWNCLASNPGVAWHCLNTVNIV